MNCSVSSSDVTLCRNEIIAAVVEPVGRNANWSVNDKVGGVDEMAGYIYDLTTNLSIHRDKTEVMT